MLKKRHRNDFVVKPKWFCSHSENGLMKNAQTAQSDMRPLKTNVCLKTR